MQEGIIGAQHLASLNMAKWGVFDLVAVPGSTKVTLRFAGPELWLHHAISGDLPNLLPTGSSVFGRSGGLAWLGRYSAQVGSYGGSC